MGFKNMKRDDHGHVISNDEQDGQKCQHQSGGNNKPQDNKQDYKASLKKAFNALDKEDAMKEINKNPELFKKFQEASRKNPDASFGYILSQLDEPFDDDYEEEFNEPSPEDEKQYIDKVMADIADASDKKAFEYVSDNIDKLTEAGLITDETSDRLMDALNRKIDEVNNDDEDLIKAINAADDDVLDEQFGKDTPERKLAGAMKNQPTGEATSDDEWNKRHQEFLERGKSTWNQKLQKGDDVTFEGPDGKEVTAKIGGFWKSGELVDDDTYEEGKDNHWHDFRAVGLVDKDGKNIGSINAYQIKKHNRQQLGTPEDFAKKTAKMPNGKEMSLFDFAHNIVNYLDNDTAAYIIASKYGVSENDAKAYLESPYNREGSKEDYNKKLAASKSYKGEIKYRKDNDMYYPVKEDGTYLDKDIKFPDLKALQDVYGEGIKEDTEDHWLRKHKHH